MTKKDYPKKFLLSTLFAQIIEGKAEIIIDGASYVMEEGECIIIPAHKSHFIKGNKRFKMILTIVKMAMNNIDTISILTKKIFKKTVEIQKEFPELYELLDETPLFFSFTDKEITIKDLRQYLISLRTQQKSFEKGTIQKNDLQ